MLAISTVSKGQKIMCRPGWEISSLGFPKRKFYAALVRLDSVDRLHQPQADEAQNHEAGDQLGAARTRSAAAAREYLAQLVLTAPDQLLQGRADCRPHRRAAVEGPCPMVPDCFHRRRPMGRRLLRFDCSRASRPLSKPCCGAARTDFRGTHAVHVIGIVSQAFNATMYVEGPNWYYSERFYRLRRRHIANRMGWLSFSLCTGSDRLNFCQRVESILGEDRIALNFRIDFGETEFIGEVDGWA